MVIIYGLALIIALTATRAGPLHARLGRLGPAPALVRQLVIIDRVRTALAVLALVAAAYSTWNWI